MRKNVAEKAGYSASDGEQAILRPARKEKNFTMTKRMHENIFGWILLAYPVLTFCIFYIGINFNSILMAFETIDIKGNVEFAGFSNFVTFIKNAVGEGTLLGISFKNSAKMYVINFIICNPLYFIFSFYLFKNFYASKLIRSIIMIPMIVSSFILGLVFKMFVENGLPFVYSVLTNNPAEDFPSLFTDPRYTFGTSIFYMIWTSFTMALILYPNAMNAIGEQIFESARIDGTNLWTEFWFIVMPLIWPTISTNLVLSVAEFFTNGGVGMLFFRFEAPPEVQTVGYFFTAQVMTGTGETAYPFLAAGGLILTAITCPVVFLVKYLLERYGPSTD